VNVADVEHPAALSAAQRRTVLTAAFLCWLCAGLQMGLTQLTSRPALLSMYAIMEDESLSDASDAEAARKAREAFVGHWFARHLCALQLGAAVGGVLLGRRADRHGRAHALGISVLCYSVFTGLGYFARTPYELTAVRFLCGLGIGGAWPAAVALAGEAWPGAAKPTVAGIIGMAANVGILAVGQIASRLLSITTDTWRDAMLVGALPALLGVLVVLWLPESPSWLALRGKPEAAKSAAPIRELFQPSLLRYTLIGIGLATVPLLGAWGSSKWMFPWADAAGQKLGQADLQARTQSTWAYGAVLASATGGMLADMFGRRATYFAFSLLALVTNLFVYGWIQPGDTWFMPLVFLVGITGTVFFGWLPLYLPELYPTAVRATGIGLTYNAGRIATAFGILIAGSLMSTFHGDYARVGTITSWVYLLGMIIILFAPPGGAKKN
jgi:MFS family permease